MSDHATLINLLPPEVQEKRRAERTVVYIVVALTALVVLLVVIYLINGLRVIEAQGRLAEIKAKNAKLEASITEFQIYEKRRNEVIERQKLVKQALVGEVLWHRILNEVSMVIPTDVWLVDFTGDPSAGVSMTGFSPDYAFDAPDVGHKPVAKWLVRLGEINEFKDIWLNSSEKSSLFGFGVINFSIKAKLKTKAGSSESSAPAPAPPAQ